ncbi:tRNA (adenine-N1)-methyltransferase [Mumia sp. Pv 4-285]|uniref:tRNA (adenine-N1)-methyltransferase n=1 Tax=Mumia qirimensis TaxID=3234852 RepID=UPI00351D93A8
MDERLSGVHRGPMAVGQWVRLTDAKGRRHNIQLEAGKKFFTKFGEIPHDALIDQPEGVVVESSLGGQYLVFRPLMHEYTTSMPRGAAVIYPKDATQIVTFADIFPGARVLEAGAGSGALTTFLLRAVGEGGLVSSYEQREDFAEIATRNVEQFFGGPHPAWRLTVGELGESVVDTEVDRMILDMVDPWEYVELAGRVLAPGGILCCYVATTTQMSRIVETLRAHGEFAEPDAWETMQRGWHLEGLAVRPQHAMNGHTAFLVTARRMAHGQRALAKKRRPAPGAYGPDYSGPRPADLPD